MKCVRPFPYNLITLTKPATRERNASQSNVTPSTRREQVAGGNSALRRPTTLRSRAPQSDQPAPLVLRPRSSFPPVWCETCALKHVPLVFDNAKSVQLLRIDCDWHLIWAIFGNLPAA